MFQKVVVICMSIVAVFLALLGISSDITDKTTTDTNDVVYFYEDLPYGVHQRNVMDLALPKNATEDVGLVLMIHGGAWVSGDKESYADWLDYCADNLNIAAATMNHRYLSDEVNMYDILDDINEALFIIKDTAKANGINITKVLLTGNSSGAHLSMLYAYKCKDTAPIPPVAVFSYCGPTDLYNDKFYTDNELGDAAEVALLMSQACGQAFTFETKEDAKDALAAISPITYVTPDICPTVICHGEKDTIVPYDNALDIIEAFKKNGVKYDFISYPNSDHFLAADPQCAQQALNLFYNYILQYLK